MKAPVKGFVAKSYPQGNIVNWFGDDEVLYSRAISGLKGHNGIDIVAPWGTPIFAVEGGRVSDLKSDPAGYGRHLRITTPEGVEWTYGHLARIDVQLGQEVKEGDQIALMGNSGFVVSGATPYWEFNPYAGTHLHLGKRPANFNYQNGYFGSVDFRADLEAVSADNKVPTQLTFISLLNQLVIAYQKLISRRKLVNAIIQVESGGNDWAIGDQHLVDWAYGPLQIRKPYLDDVNKANGTYYVPRDMLGNRRLSIWVFEKYMDIYASEKMLGRPARNEDIARIHNGGPQGYKSEATKEYWQRILKVEPTLINT